MQKSLMKIGGKAIRWKQFSHKNNAVFLSLGKEISIGVLSVATLLHAVPASASGKVSTSAPSTECVTRFLAEETETEERLDVMGFSLLEGDLLFNVTETKNDLSGAIADVTHGYNNQRVTHVAIVCRQDDRWFALEARHPRVTLTPLDKFVAKSKERNNGDNPVLLVGRLKDRSNIHESITRAIQYIGRPYDDLYLPTDSAIYCSELVQLAYTRKDGTHVFAQEPMSFHDNTLNITDFWKNYYANRGMQVPEGAPGTNPGGISRSTEINIVHTYKFGYMHETSMSNIIFESSTENKDDGIWLQDMVVTGTLAPISPEKAVKMVQVLTRKEIEAAPVQSVNDLLKMVAGVDVRQRGAFGIQTDMGINGGNSDQLTLLLNGINITNPHTGHLTVDLPTTVDDIERIEVLEGGASRVYGSSAFAGAINIVTRKDTKSCAEATVEGGSYGTFGARANGTLNTGKFSNHISASYSSSDGIDNDDFQKITAYWNGRYTADKLHIDIQGGLSKMNYGANTFYGTGSRTQWEENSRYTVAAQAEIKGFVTIRPKVYWNRSLDHYVWTRSNPAAYENFHQTNIYGASVTAHCTWIAGTTGLGVEFRRENILSTRLGKEIEPPLTNKVPGHDVMYKYRDGRSDVGIHFEHNITAIKNVSISAGVLANYNSSVIGGMRFYPGIDISWTPISEIRLFASFNQSLRTPTYTDLYYNGPGLQGNSELKPEKSTDFGLGIKYTKGIVSAQIKGYYRRGTDMIDWVKLRNATVWTTANSNIMYAGAEALINLNFNHLWGKHSWLKNMTIGYCFNHQERTNVNQTDSYASELHYLRHKLTVQLSHRIIGRMTAHWNLSVRERKGQFDNVLTGELQKYGVISTLDLRLQWEEKHVVLFVQGNNLTNHRYYEVSNVQQPGFWFMGGIKVKI